MNFNYQSEKEFYKKEPPIIEKAKIMIAVLLVLASVFMFAQRLVLIVGGLPEDKIIAAVAFVFVIIGLLVFVE